MFWLSSIKYIDNFVASTSFIPCIFDYIKVVIFSSPSTVLVWRLYDEHRLKSFKKIQEIKMISTKYNGKSKFFFNDCWVFINWSEFLQFHWFSLIQTRLVQTIPIISRVYFQSISNFIELVCHTKSNDFCCKKLTDFSLKSCRIASSHK